MKAGRRPYISEKVPINEGAMPWTIIYVVIVKATLDWLTLRSEDMVLIAGKYILDDNAEKEPPRETRHTITHFLPFEKTWYGFSVIRDASTRTSVTELAGKTGILLVSNRDVKIPG